MGPMKVQMPLPPAAKFQQQGTSHLHTRLAKIQIRNMRGSRKRRERRAIAGQGNADLVPIDGYYVDGD